MRERSVYLFLLILGTVLVLGGLVFALSISNMLPLSVVSLPELPPMKQMPDSSVTKLKVVVSIFPLADFVRSIGRDKVEVISLLPTGASPHTYEPTPGQVKEVAEAKVFVKNGLGLEFWSEKIIKAAANPDLIMVDTSEGISLIDDESDSQSVTEGILANGTPWRLTEGGSRVEIGGVSYSVKALESQEELCEAEVCQAWHEIKQQIAVGCDEHYHVANPHIWLDPVLAQQQIKNITKALILADPSNKEFYEKNEAWYLTELEALHKSIQKTVNTFQFREFITFHPAWTYFAARYGLVEAAVIEVAPGKEASPAHIKEVVGTAKRLGVKAVFAEPQFNPRTAERIAEEANVRVLFLDPLGGDELNDRNSYIELMTYNLEQMELAMGK